MSEYWIQTFSGKRFDLLNPTVDMICIEDIAHHLSIINRFVGASKFAYSVGYHCVLACKQAPEYIKLETLLHEIDEPYINDISYPFKTLLDYHTTIHRDTAQSIKKLGAKKFLLSTDLAVQTGIEHIDACMAVTEEVQLMKNSGYLHGLKYNGLEPYNDIEILKLQPENVEKLFLTEFEKWRRN